MQETESVKIQPSETPDITKAGQGEEEAEGLGIMWIVILIILALIFLAIAIKCYLNTRRESNRKYEVLVVEAETKKPKNGPSIGYSGEEAWVIF